MDLEVDRLEDEPGLRVSCSLPSGSYVTVLLDALVGPTLDASRVPRSTDEEEGRGVS